MTLDIAKLARVEALMKDLVSRDISGLSDEELLELFNETTRLRRAVHALKAVFDAEAARRSTLDGQAPPHSSGVVMIQGQTRGARDSRAESAATCATDPRT